MRLLELYLKAFGHFTERRLDLSGGREGLHLVFGRNEAGKSSALRALRALLYGFPKQTGDDFVHPYDQLRVGGRLRLADGRELAFLRRKGQKSTLLSLLDESPLDDGLLDGCLQGIDEKLFASLFGIDHGALIEGGRELLEQKGDVGQALFAAGLGTRSLRRVLQSLDEEADALFRPRGQVKRINQAIAEHQKARREQADRSLSGRQWDERRKHLEKLRQESAGLDRRLAAAKTAQHRLARLRRALPRLAARRELLARRAALGEVVLLGMDFPARRREAQEAIRAAVQKREKALADLAEVREQAAELAVPREILDQAETIEALHQGVRKHEDDQTARSRLLAESAEQRARAAELLEEIRPGLALEEAEPLRHGLERWRRIQELGLRRQDLDTALAQARRDVLQVGRRLAAAQDSLAALPAAQDPAPLRRRLEAARKAGDLDRTLAAALNALRQEEEQLGLELSRLGLWQGLPAALEALPVPAPESLEHFRDAFAAIAERRRTWDDQGRSLRAELADAERGLDEIRRGGAVPTEDELRAARTHRDREWAVLRRAWVAGEAVPAGQADVYEEAVREADDLADRLRREAGRVQRQAQLLARRDQLTRALTALEADLSASALEEGELRGQWTALWAPCGFAPRPPKEMQAWAARCEKLRARAEALRGERRHAEDLEQARRGHRNALLRELKALGQPAIEGGELEPVLARAAELLQVLDDRSRERERLEETVRESGAELAAARDAETAALTALAEWQDAWGEAVAGLGFDRDALPGEVRQFVETLREVFASLNTVAKLEIRLAALERELDAFRSSVRTLAAQTAPDLAGQPAGQAAVQLHARLGEARRQETQRRELERRTTRLEAEIRDAEVESRATAERLAALLREAGCAEESGLEEAEKKSSDVQGIARDLARIESELLDDGDGLSLEELEREAGGVDGGALPAEIEHLEQEIAALAERSGDLREELGRDEQELKSLTGEGGAAEAAARAQEILAGLREDADRYVRLRLAAAVLRQEIEKYRSENQAPVLRRAGALFTALTLGKYHGLQTDFDKDDEPVLAALRDDGKRVRVEGMSDGTRDQLYLALRLATLERYLAHTEPLPFIVDDILINFDDERSAATLQVLADLAAKTQVILFTHHAHLRDLAAGVQNGAGVFVQELR